MQEEISRARGVSREVIWRPLMLWETCFLGILLWPAAILAQFMRWRWIAVSSMRVEDLPRPAAAREQLRVIIWRLLMRLAICLLGIRGRLARFVPCRWLRVSSMREGTLCMREVAQVQSLGAVWRLLIWSVLCCPGIRVRTQRFEHYQWTTA